MEKNSQALMPISAANFSSKVQEEEYSNSNKYKVIFEDREAGIIFFSRPIA